jgi:hypothetical protein
MYKKRLKFWAVRKYDTDATLGVLLRCIKARQECGKASVILKNGQPYHIDRIQSHILKKHTTADQLLQNTGPEASLPPGFVCTTPQPAAPEDLSPIERDAMSDRECQPRHEISPSIPPTTASSTSESKDILTPLSSQPTETSRSSSGSVLTPQSSESADQGRFIASQSVSCDQGHAHGNEGHSGWPPHGRDDTDEALWVDMVETQSSPNALDMSSEVFRLSSPESFSSGDELNTDLHRLLGKPAKPLTPPIAAPSTSHGKTSPGSSKTEEGPETFIAHCYLSCIAQSQGDHVSADHYASKAFQMYGALTQQRHESALACLNLVLAVLFIHGRGEEATAILKGARKAALDYLDEEDPIILTINFMISQATGISRESGINIPQLRAIYDEFKARFSAKHAYTLLAGYHLAWRLAMNDNTGKTEAYQILCAIHEDALAALGENHPQSIAIVTTKARVLHDLGHYEEGESVMSDAVRLVERAYPSKHPYLLEIKRRHAVLLWDIGEIEAAEENYIEVALGRVEVLGPDHSFSQASVLDVESFLYGEERESELQSFRTKLARARKQSATRNPVLDF